MLKLIERIKVNPAEIEQLNPLILKPLALDIWRYCSPRALVLLLNRIERESGRATALDIFDMCNETILAECEYLENNEIELFEGGTEETVQKEMMVLQQEFPDCVLWQRATVDK